MSKFLTRKKVSKNKKLKLFESFENWNENDVKCKVALYKNNIKLKNRIAFCDALEKNST